MFNLVLVEPEIPQNTGNIGRLCLATGATLHLVHPLGFQLDDAALKRAGMDYWKKLTVVEHPSFAHFQIRLGGARCFYCSTKAKRAYWDIQYREGDFLIFGRETRGLPEELLEKNPDNAITVPMPNSAARSLNLATAAGIVLYEALRQQQATGWPK
jgi:tRNA (cytidine/uridine-2'-O-)-methyltransferase